jgi:hypothetical protein
MRQQLCLIFRQIALLLCLGWGAVGACAQQFVQPVVIPTGNWPAAIFNADVNGDGTQDLIYMDYGATPAASTTHVLLNDGKGNFAPASGAIATAGTSLVITNMVPGGPVDLEWVAVSGNTGSIYLAQGSGDGTFQAAMLLTSFSLSGANMPVLRLAYANLSSGNPYRTLLIEDTANAELYEMVSPPGIATAVNPGIPLLAGATEMIAQDINGDGITDVLIQGSHGVEVFLGQPAYGFKAPVTYPCTGTVNSMLLYDVDNDGIADLTVEGADGGYDVYHGAADGTFSAASEGGTQAHDPTTGYGGFLIGVTTVGPTNATRRHFYTATPAGLSVLLGQGNVTYLLKGIYNMGPGRTNYAFADFNGDGYPDVAVDSPQGIAILYGNADSSMQSSLAFAAGQPAYSVALGKFTGSGNVDAAVATGIPQVQLMNGDGGGNFAVAGAAAPAGAAQTDANRDTWSNVAEGDFDGDGKPDVAITLEGGASASGTTEGLSILFGNGTYSVVNEPSPGFGVSAVGDFNGDGSSDVLNFDGSYGGTYTGGVSSRSGTMARDILFTGSGSGGGPAFNLVAAGFLKAGRTNKQDVVVESGANFMVYQNNGDGTFTKENTIIPPGTFASPTDGTLPSSGYFPGSMVLADLDGDGFGDLIIAFDNLASDPKNPSGAAALTYIYWGEGNGQFSTPTVIASTRNLYQVAAVSFEANAQPQLVSSDGYLVNVLPFQGRVPNAASEKQYLAGQGINLVAAGDVNGDGRADLVIANGGLVLSNPVASGGVLASNSIVNSGGVTVLLNTQKSVDVTGTLSASPEPSLYADNFTLTATITQPAGMPQATGSVMFSVDGAVVGTAALVNGVASFTVIPPPYSTGPPVVTGYIVGQHTITAVYAGDGNYNSLTLNGTHSVIGQPTTSTITQLDTTIYYGQEIGYDNGVDAQLQAYPTNAGATGAPIDGGTLTTYIDGAIVCQAMSGTTFRCPDPPFEGFNAGQHSVVLAYSGNDYYAGSTSITYTVTILPDDTTTVVSGAPNPSTFGQSVMFTATTTAPFATPTPGTVTFFDGSTVIGTGSVNAQGVATFSTARLSVGTHNIGASFAASVNSSGTLNFNPSPLGVVSQTVLPPETSAVATVTLLTSNINPSVVGQNVLFTAAVETTGAFVIVPVGAVQFLDGGSVIGTGLLDSKGVATFTTSALTAGLHTMTAVYAGNTATAGSISPALMQQVNTGLASAGTGFVMTVTPTVVSAGAGNTTTVSVMITELNNFSEPVQLSCSGLPNEASCTFATSLIPAGGGTTMLLIGASAPHNCGSKTPYFVAGGRRGIGIFAVAVMLFFVRRRRVLKGLVLAVAIYVLPMLSGCGGNCTDLGTKPGNYTFTVTGTSTGSPVVTQTQVVKMTVTI